MHSFLLSLIFLISLPTQAFAEETRMPDAEASFREIATDQFMLTTQEISAKVLQKSALIKDRMDFGPQDFPALTYVALNFDTNEMGLLTPQYEQAKKLCKTEAKLLSSCFLLDSAWLALFAESNEEFVKSLEPYYEQMNDTSPKTYQLLVQVRWSTLMTSVNRFQKSLEMVHRALSLVEEMGLNDVYRVILYNNLSLVYSNFGEFDRAIEYIQKTIEICEKMGFRPVTAHYYLNAANMVSRYVSLHPELPKEKIKELAQQMRAFADKAESIGVRDYSRSDLILQRGYEAYIEKDLKKAKSFYQQALQKEESNETQTEIRIYLARIALLENRYEAGLHELQLAEKVKPKDNTNLQTLFLEAKGGLLQAVGRYQEAADLYKTLSELQGRMFREQFHSKFTQNLIDSSLQFKEDEARRLQLENAQKEQELTFASRIKMLSVFLLLSLVAAMFLLWISWKQARHLTRQHIHVIRQRDLIERQHQRMRMIFDNVQVGILEIDEQRLVRPDHSRALIKILNLTEDPVSKSLRDLLEGHLQMDRGAEAMFWSALDSIVGEDATNWEINNHHLLSEVSYQDRTLQFHWQPNIHANFVLSLSVIISDVTLQKQAASLKNAVDDRAAKQTARLMELNRGSVQRSLQLLRRLPAVLEKLDQHQHKGQSRELLQDVHTLKGEARSLGLLQLQEACHRFEEACTKAQPVAELDFSAFRWELGEYSQLAEFWQGRMLEENKNLAELLAPMMEEVRQRILHAGCRWQGYVLEDGIGSFDERSWQSLSTMLLHGLTNATDHGYISPKEQGRTPGPALFHIQTTRQGSHYLLQIRDSGVGINYEKLRKIAQDKGFSPASGRPLTDLLFQDGVSTSDQVSLTSGRGVGLSAIAQTVQGLGGSVSLRDNDRGTGSLLEISWPISALESPLQAG